MRTKLIVALVLAGCTAQPVTSPRPSVRELGRAESVAPTPAFRIYEGNALDIAWIATDDTFMHRVDGKAVANVCSRCGIDLKWGYTVLGPPCGVTIKRGCAKCLIETWGQ